MHIQLVQVLQQRSERCAFCHLGESVYILREALATVAELAVGTGNVGVGVVDVAREEDAGVCVNDLMSGFNHQERQHKANQGFNSG